MKSQATIDFLLPGSALRNWLSIIHDNELAIGDRLQCLSSQINSILDGEPADKYRPHQPRIKQQEFSREAMLAALSQPAQTTAPLNVVSEIAAERRRQLDYEGWHTEHDDEHVDGSLALAAAAYAIPEVERDLILRQEGETGSRICQRFHVPIVWPQNWTGAWYKPKGARRDLVRAAALIVAEIERLDRLNATPKSEGTP